MNVDNVELACRDLVFHFNKAYLQDPEIPMWVVKTKGKTYYVDHVEANIPWSTKETPDNEHTKGSIKFKNCLCTIDEFNCATISELTEEDKFRLSAKERPIIVMTEGRDIRPLVQNLGHYDILVISGACTTTKYVVQLKKESDLTYLSLQFNGYRVLNENEMYYKRYIKWLWNDKDPQYEYVYEEDYEYS